MSTYVSLITTANRNFGRGLTFAKEEDARIGPNEEDGMWKTRSDSRKTTPVLKETERSGKTFLQPLALASVCLFLIFLLLVMKLVDLKTLDRTLVDSIENRGLEVVRNVKQVTELYDERFFETGQSDLDVEIGPSVTESSFSLPEAFIRGLIASAQEIDYQLGAAPSVDTVSSMDELLRDMAYREGLWRVTIWDEKGDLSYKSGPVPQTLSALARPVLDGREEIKIHILTSSGSQQKFGFIVLRRKFAPGTVAVALDEEAFQFWRLKVSLQRAIEEVGRVPEIGYFLVMDRHLRIIGRSEGLGEINEDFDIETALPKAEVNQRNRKIEMGGKKWLDMFAPIRLQNGFSGVVRMGLSMESAEQVLVKNRRDILISMAFMVVIAVLSMWLLYKNQNKHLAKMGEMERRIQQAERLSALGRLAAGVAHEIRNPLNAISMASQRLQRDNLQQLSEVIRDEIRRLNQIIEEFLSISRSRKLQFKRGNLIHLLDQIVILMGDEAESQGVTIKMAHHDNSFDVSMDADKLKQALINIIKNGIESIPGDGSIDIALTTEKKEWIGIRISDTGSGLKAEEMKHVFDPDYTTKEKGLGLGLPLAYEIVKGHGGDIQVSSRPGEGTTFDIILPLDGRSQG